MSFVAVIRRGYILNKIQRNDKWRPCIKRFVADLSENNVLSTDVVISGGGMVGTAMACALGNEPVLQNKKIVLLEAGQESQFDKLPEKYRNRVSALSPATLELLKGFGAWENICKMRLQEVKRMQVWDSCSHAMISFNNDDTLQALAYIVENDVTVTAINEQLKKLGNRVVVKYGAKVKKYNLADENSEKIDDQLWTEVVLEDDSVIRTKLLIGADGFGSLVRKTANAHTLQWNYDQMGVVATLQLSEPMANNVAWQRFLPNGPIALLSLSDTLSSLVWTTSNADAKNLLQLPSDSFVDAVNDALWSNEDENSLAVFAGQCLDTVINIAIPNSTTVKQLPPSIVGVDEGSRAAFPLGLSHATQYVSHRMALIGDAAHRIHPLAGQGVNLGFGDVMCLRDKLVEAVSEGKDIGSMSHLLEYERKRQWHNLPVMFSMDGLNRLYSNDFTPLVVLRSLGLQMTNALGPVKNFFKRKATNG